LSGIAASGPIPPYVSPLNEKQLRQLEPVAQALAGAAREQTA